MSSVTSHIAQIGRRINYFRVLADLSGYQYDVSQNTSTYNSWNAQLITAQVTIAVGVILQDMGEMAKVDGQIFRKVRVVDQTPAGGKATPFFILTPGGEYPMQGYGAVGVSGPTQIAPVARLG